MTTWTDREAQLLAQRAILLGDAENRKAEIAALRERLERAERERDEESRKRDKALHTAGEMLRRMAALQERFDELDGANILNRNAVRLQKERALAAEARLAEAERERDSALAKEERTRAFLEQERGRVDAAREHVSRWQQAAETEHGNLLASERALAEARAERDAFASTYHAVNEVLLSGSTQKIDPTAERVYANLTRLMGRAERAEKSERAAEAQRDRAVAALRLLCDAAFVSDTQFVCPTAFEPAVRAARTLLKEIG